jgi:hypothetical protein
MADSYASIKKYFEFMKSVSERSNKFLIGNFYAYEYHFDKTDKDFDELKFYDKYPLIYLISKGPTDNTFYGLNLHQIPVRSRLIWLTRFDKIAEILQEDQRAIYRYEFIKSFFIKAVFGVRMYRADRIVKLRRVDSTKMYDLSRFYSKTYYGTTIDAIEVRYANYNPYK